jgi:hypothetical protein
LTCILIHRGRSVFIIAIKEFPSLGLQNKPLISIIGPIQVFGYFTILRMIIRSNEQVS